MAEFLSQRDVKLTKKIHHCEGCGKFIDVGSAAYYFAVKDDGQFFAGYYHPDCRKAETDWNDLCGYWGDEYGALWSV